eukprot:s296_g45.t1
MWCPADHQLSRVLHARRNVVLRRQEEVTPMVFPWPSAPWAPPGWPHGAGRGSGRSGRWCRDGSSSRRRGREGR